jgi:hypothetical protein
MNLIDSLTSFGQEEIKLLPLLPRFTEDLSKQIFNQLRIKMHELSGVFISRFAVEHFWCVSGFIHNQQTQICLHQLL